MNKVASEIRGLLLPLAGSNLLLPNAAVVEVLRLPEVSDPPTDAPDWFKGRFEWRHISLPLVSWDHLLGQEVSGDKGGRRRVAVCHLFSAGKSRTFVGIETYGMPNLLTVVEADLEVEDDLADKKSCILGEVTVKGVDARIPDLDALGKKIKALG